ncbi:MAG: hypothetical protein QOI10_4586 [Solirubrobacterales bacterium]|nr:hypothetical protein [Solirubrobacterales bacterium]
MPEARLDGGIPQTAGWFVLNARDAPWVSNEMATRVNFGGEGEAHFDDLGFRLYWLEPGQPMGMYHHEAGQEDFLVVRGRCLLIVEGIERDVATWDLVHCPSRTSHILVGAGDEPALIVAVGARKERGSVEYPVAPVAIAHGAGVHEGERPYARFSELRRCPAPPLF